MSTPTVDRAAAPPPGGRVAGQRGGAARRRQAGPALTGRGGIVLLFGATLAGALLTGWTGFTPLAAAGFVLGCVAAALLTRPTDLPLLVVSPPLVFLAGTLLAAILLGLGEPSLPRAVAVGLLASLAGTAPWLLLGTVLTVAISVPRGLFAQIRELRERLAGLRLFHEEENADPVRWDEAKER